MKLKDLKDDEHNILDFISFFDKIADTKPYFTELIFKYGERELLSKVENLFLDSGLGGIGMVFDLKRYEWGQLELLSEKLLDDGLKETTTVKTKERLDTVDKTGTNSSNVSDNDFIVAYDEDVDTKQSGSTKSDTIESTENLTNEETGTDTTVVSGYDKNRIEFITKMFREYPNYRLEIYDDIVDILCVKVYN